MSAPMDLSKVFLREIETNEEKTLEINQNAVGDVGCVVWDAALVLSKYLETEDFDNGRSLQDKRIVGLGSGTGVVGLMAASHGYRASVTITDLEKFVPLMQMNIDANQGQFKHLVMAKTLKWGYSIGDAYSNTDIVLVADCVYYEQSIEPLVQTIGDLCGETTCVYCSSEEREDSNKPELQRKFFQLVGEKFSVEKIPLARQNPEFRSEDIHVYKFTRVKKK